MYQKDFILRMIEMLADLVAGILRLIRKGDFEQASVTLENAYYDYLKQDASYFRSIPNASLTDEMLGKHNYTNGHLEMLAGLFFAQAELSTAQGNTREGLEYYEKSLLLYTFVFKGSDTFSLEMESKIGYIHDRIAGIKESSG
jgi:hypothetical protein